MRSLVYCLAVIGGFLLISPAVKASTLAMLAGPSGAGAGGSNPLGIPPGADDLLVTYVTDKDSEWTLSIFPGLFYGTRQEFKTLYASFGGGLTINHNGAGPGVVSAFGFNMGDTWLFNGEYRQSIGFDFANKFLLNTYALRLGLAVRF